MREALEKLLRDGRVVRAETLEEKTEPRQETVRLAHDALADDEAKSKIENRKSKISGPGELHEFFLIDDLPALGHRWGSPNLLMTALLAETQLQTVQGQRGAQATPLPLCLNSSRSNAQRGIAWIGRKCWPTFQVLCAALGRE